MKILILNYEYPPLGGGAGVCTQFQAEGLAALGHQVTVLTTWFENHPEKYSENKLIVIRLKSKRKHVYKSNPVEMLSWVWHAKNYFKNNAERPDFDICLANFAIPGGIVAKYLKNKYQIPYIIESHGQDIPFFFPKQMLKYHLITYFWVKHLVNHSEKLILLSKEMKANADRFTGLIRARKNIIIPNGCEMNLFKPSNVPKYERFTILFVGRLVAQKDPFTFLKAMKEFAKTGIDFEVQVFGNGPLYEKMVKFCMRNQLKQIVFKGWTDKHELINAYQRAHLQIFSSLDEAMSIAALESLSCGQYLISTPVSGNTELITENINGEFFPKHDFKTLPNKIEHYYHTKFKSKYQVDSNFLETFREKYSWNQVIKKYEHVLLEISEKQNK